MVKFFFILRRKSGLSAEEFHRYWKHGPIVSRLPGLELVNRAPSS